ncbi:MAG: AhpC/TSA family protein, partial [Chitinophagaceae bacterium]|nr:AhpC/TSA family protein [Chitinophagaceae bacterium]
MKRIVLTSMAMAAMQWAWSQHFTLNGTLPDPDLSVNAYVYLSYKQMNETVLDSCQLKDQAYQFSGRISYPVSARLFLKVPDSVGDHYARTHLLKPYEHEFYLDQGAITARSEGKMIQTVVKGSAADKDRQELSGTIKAIYAKRNALYDKDREKAYKAKDSIAVANINRKYFAFEDDVDAAKLQFAQQHPKSGIALKLLMEYFDSNIDPFIAGPLFDQLLPALKASPEGVAFAKRLEKARTIATGKDAPAVALKDRDGKIISLASLKGKVVLLDFWGSWCYPCRMSHPHLKALYEKFKPLGFEILGVSNERGEASTWYGKWVKALDEDQMSWLNVLNETAATEKGKGVLEAYDVQAYPTKILIDRDGKVLVKLVGNSEKNKELLE